MEKYKIDCADCTPEMYAVKNEWQTVPICKRHAEQVNPIEAIGTPQWRKRRPVYSGVLAYFPDAIMEVAYASWVGNEQHNAGQPLHWDRSKSKDQLDACARHLIDNSKNPIDTDGVYHLAKEAWRAMAELQVMLENNKQ